MRYPLRKKLRFEVFKRDGFRCTYCGQRPPDVVLVVDHVVPVSRGGTDDPENLATSCHACNAGKGATNLTTALPAMDEDAIAEAMQEVAERRMAMTGYYAEQRALQEDIEQLVCAVRDRWDDLCDEAGDPQFARRAKQRFERRSIVGFARRGLGLAELEQAIDLVSRAWGTEGSRTVDSLWLQFCRICWDAIRTGEGAT